MLPSAHLPQSLMTCPCARTETQKQSHVPGSAIAATSAGIPGSICDSPWTLRATPCSPHPTHLEGRQEHCCCGSDSGSDSVRSGGSGGSGGGSGGGGYAGRQQAQTAPRGVKSSWESLVAGQRVRWDTCVSTQEQRSGQPTTKFAKTAPKGAQCSTFGMPNIPYFATLITRIFATLSHTVVPNSSWNVWRALYTTGQNLPAPQPEARCTSLVAP